MSSNDTLNKIQFWVLVWIRVDWIDVGFRGVIWREEKGNWLIGKKNKKLERNVYKRRKRKMRWNAIPTPISLTWMKETTHKLDNNNNNLYSSRISQSYLFHVKLSISQLVKYISSTKKLEIWISNPTYYWYIRIFNFS